MSVLQAKGLTIGYGGRPERVLASSLDLQVNAGELVCLLGPNGAGKSTLLRTLAGMQVPLAGTVRILGDDVRRLSPLELAKRLSVVLTERPDAGLLTGYAMVALGRHPYTDWQGRLTKHDREIVEWAVEVVGARPIAVMPMSEMSDGQRQKIMIARALAQQPALIFLDEPTAFLDLPGRVEIVRLLQQLAHEMRRAVLLSTHDLDLILRYADRVWLLSTRGTLMAGTPEDLVLSGAFEEVFGGAGLPPEMQADGFQQERDERSYIEVRGAEMPALWTRRALERAGFATEAQARLPVARVRVERDQQNVADLYWYLEMGQEERCYHSIEGLLTALRTSESVV